MVNLDEMNQFVSKLSVKGIQDLSDEEIVNLAMERPGHPGQYGFMLNPAFYASEEQMANTMNELLHRLHKVDKLDEKMKMKKQA